MPEIGGPPFPGFCHKGCQVLLKGCEIQAPECRCIVKILIHGVGKGSVLAQDIQGELAWPPVAGTGSFRAYFFCGARNVVERALTDVLCVLIHTK